MSILLWSQSDTWVYVSVNRGVGIRGDTPPSLRQLARVKMRYKYKYGLSDICTACLTCVQDIWYVYGLPVWYVYVLPGMCTACLVCVWPVWYVYGLSGMYMFFFRYMSTIYPVCVRHALQVNDLFGILTRYVYDLADMCTTWPICVRLDWYLLLYVRVQINTFIKWYFVDTYRVSDHTPFCILMCIMYPKL